MPTASAEAIPVLRRVDDPEFNAELSLPGGVLQIDWDEELRRVWVAGLGVEPLVRRNGIATALLDSAYQLVRDGGTLAMGTIVAAPGANEGLQRVQARLAAKYNVQIGHWRSDPTPE